MSVRLEPFLSDRLFHLLGGEHLDENLSKIILLITVDEKGWPYVAILSYLETIAPDRRNIRIAPWNISTTSANMRRNGKATLVVVDQEMAYYIQGTARELVRDLEDFPGTAKVNVRIECILEDKALDYEGSARITTGIRFENPQMDSAYIERGKQVLALLRI